MKQFLTYTLILVLLVSCNQINKPKKPDNLIPKDKMVVVLTDLSILNAAKGIDKMLIEKEGVNPTTYIYTKHNIDSAQFADSNNYYAFDIDTYDALYKRVKQNLEAQKKQYKVAEDKAIKTRDSLRKLKPKGLDSSKLKNRIFKKATN